MHEHFIANQAARRFEEIDFERALSEGRRYLCLDLDNTLLPQTGLKIERAVKERLAQVRDSGLAQDVCLISNVILPGPRVSRLRQLAAELEISHVVPGYFFTRKPKPHPFRRALELLRAQPQECVMVGDQIFSDILGGNRMGFYTVWLEPMSGDHWSTLITGRRYRERAVIQEMHRRGLLAWQKGTEVLGPPLAEKRPERCGEER